MADGSLIFDTKIATDGIKKGLSAITTSIGAVTAGLTAATTACIGLGSKFETSFAKASTLFGDVSVDVDNLNKNILALSSASGESAVSLNEALYSALSAGVEVTEDMGTAMDFLTQATKLAKSGFTDTNTAVSALASVQNAYGKEAYSVDQISKMLLQTQNDGVTTVGELAASLGDVTGSANNAGIGFDQVSAALATSTAVTLNTAKSTTQLKTLIQELSDTTSELYENVQQASKAVTGTSMTFGELQDAGYSLSEIMQMVSDYADSSGKSMYEMMSSSEAVNAALLMTGENAEVFAKNLADMTTETDIVGESYSKMADTFETKKSQVIESTKNLGIEIYNSLLEGSASNMADVAIQYIDQLTTGFEQNGLEGLIDALGQVITSLVTKAVEFAPKMINLAVQLIRSFIDGLKENAPTVIEGVLSVITSLVEGGLSLLPEIAELALQLIVSLALGLVEYAPKLIPVIIDVILNLVDTIINNIDMVVSAAAQIVDGLIKGLINAIPKLIQGAIKLLMAIVDALPVIIDSLTENLPVIVEAIINGLIEGLPMLLEGAVTLFMAIVDAIPQIIESLQAALPQICLAIINAIINAAPELLECAISYFGSMVGAIPVIIGKLLEAVPQILDAILGVLGDLPAALWNNVLSPAIDRFLQWGADVIESGRQAASNFIDNVIEFISTLPEKIAYWIGYALGTIINWGISLIEWAIVNIPIFIDSIITFFSELPEKVWEWLLNTINRVTEWFNQMVTKAKETGSKFVENLINFIKNLPSRIYTWLTNTINKVVNFKDRMFSKADETGKGFFDRLVDGVKELPEKMKEIGSNIVSGIWNGINEGWDWLLDSVKNLANSLFQGAKDALDIHSPSRKFKWIGEMCVEGMDEPLEDYNPYDTLKKSMHYGAISGNLLSSNIDVSGPDVMAVSTKNTIENVQAGMIRESKPPEIDCVKMGGEIAKEIVRVIDGMAVMMEARPVGKVIAPIVNEEMGRLNSRRT